MFFSLATHAQSCEAYKHKGKTSGYYYIDVDGSGPIKPQLVYCNMTGDALANTNTLSVYDVSVSHSQSYLFTGCPEDRGWMMIPHNNTELTRLLTSPESGQHSVHFDYATDEEQLLAIISQSEHCEQELSYHCRKSRLLNSPGEVQGVVKVESLYLR